MKNKMIRTMIGGSVAAALALTISIPSQAHAASIEKTEIKYGTSYSQLVEYLKNLNKEGKFIVIGGTTVVAKPQATPVPTAKPVPSATTAPTAAPVPTATAAPVVKPVPTATPAATATPAPTAKPVATPAPTAKPVATAAPVADSKASYTQQIVTLVNKERAAEGLAPVSALESLNKVAAAKATDMRTNNYFSHTSPTYGSPFDMMSAFGVTYNYAGENIAMGQRTPEEVMTAWMNSPGHRSNILSKNFNYIGVGFDNNYWVQEFIGK